MSAGIRKRSLRMRIWRGARVARKPRWDAAKRWPQPLCLSPTECWDLDADSPAISQALELPRWDSPERLARWDRGWAARIFGKPARESVCAYGGADGVAASQS